MGLFRYGVMSFYKYKVMVLALTAWFKTAKSLNYCVFCGYNRTLT